MIQNLKSELSGNFELLIKSMMRTPAQLEAHDLKKAIEVIIDSLHIDLFRHFKFFFFEILGRWY